MEIIEYDKSYENQVKDLLVELQRYIIEIDKYKLNILSKDYRNKYFDNTYQEVYSNNGKIFIATENKKAVGMIAAFVRQYDEKDYLDYACPKCGIISELIISKSCRAKGVGHAEEYLKSIKCSYIKIEVFVYNDVAINFYKKYKYEYRCVDMIKKI